MIEYAAVADAVAERGLIARGGFVADETVPALPDGRTTAAVVVVGNAGGAMWPQFSAAREPGVDSLDRWTRSVLAPVAERFGGAFVHPSDEPFQPFQQWVQRADDVWQSPIGLIIHPQFGLWHAYRGAFLFAETVTGVPVLSADSSPCVTCVDQPCLTTCPVEAFTADGYNNVSCAEHVRSGDDPVCLTGGCAARRACPVGQDFRYDTEQMEFHMRAFAGMADGAPGV